MYCKKCGKQIEDSSKFCEFCGASFSDESQQVEPMKVQSESPQQNYPPPQQGYAPQQGYVPQNVRGGVTELVLGIISIIMSGIIFFQSCAVGLGNAILENEDDSGSAGIMVAIFIFIGGIVGMATRKSDGKGGAITAGVFYLIASLIGFSAAGGFGDLKIYAVISLIFGAVLIWAAISRKKG